MDWGLVVEHGRKHAWSRGVSAALRLANDCLGVAVPQEVLAALGADALEGAMLAVAMEHLIACTELPDDLRTAPNLLALAGKRGVVQKTRTVLSRVFVSRAELALLYGLPERSPRLHFYYAVRLRDLLRRYTGSAWALSVSDPELAVAAARQARLVKWVGKA